MLHSSKIYIRDVFMRKIIFVILGFITACLLFINILNQNVMMFVYSNPYTETSGFTYIAKTLKNIDKILSETKYSLSFEGKKIKYVYQNPYGSGFLKNNPIPNDLDYAVGVDLGTYNYDSTKESANEIATELVDKINTFYFYFISNLYSSKFSKFYATEAPFGILDLNAKRRDENIADIADNLDNIVSDKRYIKYTVISATNEIPMDINLPYIMNSNEILLQDSKQFKLYTDTISYNDKMPHYMREFSIIPEFYVKIKNKDNKVKEFELVPEVFPGTRLQLSRRCFGSTVFYNLNSIGFLKNVDWLNNDDRYIYTRLLSFRRHLGEIESLQTLKKSPVKILKRIMQSAEMVKPVLKEEDYEMIVDFVKTNFENRDMQLLNENLNIYKNMHDIISNKELFNVLFHSDKLKKMLYSASEATMELKKRGNADKTTISELEKMNKYIEDNVINIEKFNINDFDTKKMDSLADNIESVIVSEMNSLLYKPETIKSIVDIYTKVYTDAGFHRVKFVWLGKNKIGIIEDDFTRKIKDFKKFAMENYLVEDVEYCLVSTKQLKRGGHYISFVLWTKNNLSSDEKKGYDNLISKLLDDKKNFKTKLKWTWVR